ncbi:hypothetical protein [Streptomyces sp. AC555_RSS877]|uniref:hypothetical protein n=1 Tax=Streptomyces sp. AC555_RSS877 TaxID=2823688 RepID=UPI001C275293|nr:hypothetical protein [Streptomyces sp. AC555_RSS877]
MITHSDEGPEFEPDDPLAVILRPASDYLGPPAGRYAAIRRRAARRRLVRAAAGVGVTCAVAALAALPFRLATHEGPATPSVPLAPPPASSPSVPPDPSATPVPGGSAPTTGAPSQAPTPSGPAGTSVPAGSPSPTAASQVTERPTVASSEATVPPSSSDGP